MYGKVSELQSQRDSLAGELAEDFFLSESSDDKTLAELFPSIKLNFWDIYDTNDKQYLMPEGLRESNPDVIDIVASEPESLPMDHIILGGISQGNKTALLWLLSSGLQFGRFLDLRSWLPFDNTISDMAISTPEEKAAVPQICELINGPSSY
ncbi:hypothetical protein BJ878DRAFT_481151 [Calycina marina]|uniref:Uncharacterized protein n=1 Tax=Calycina marina TaxID=1763456 RepID=A0A9P8CE43_9HELO|nr:hypothetical protein BJ878DRAFT_481151 [Calycina marina]